MIITLTVKDGEGAETIALARLNAWFAEGGHSAPFPPGTLLHYAIHRDQPATDVDDHVRTVLAREHKHPHPQPCAPGAYDCSPDPALVGVTLTDVPWVGNVAAGVPQDPALAVVKAVERIVHH